MERQNGHIYEFADFRLIPAEGLLLRNGSPIPLTPKAFSTLVLLVEQHGHLVEKTELIERIWENAFVEEAAVSRCVWGIRNALREDPKNKKFIQTVPKRGYRFVGEVTEFHTETNNGNGAPARSKQALRTVNEPSYQPTTGLADSGIIVPFRVSRERLAILPAVRSESEIEGKSDFAGPVTARPAYRKTTNKIAALIALVVLFSVSIGAYLFYNRTPAPGGIGESRLAVLPLVPVNVENRDPIVEFAIAESLILKLSSSKNLGVRPLTAVRKYVELDRDPIKSGRELNVDFVLSSNYQIVNDKIRVTSQLWNVLTGQTEGTFQSETDRANAFTMQDVVANEIGNAVATRFGGDAGIFTTNRGTANEEAYRLYLQGMYLSEKYNRKDAARAIEIFDEAIKLDPLYAAAWAGKAHAHCNFGHRGGNAPVVEFTYAEPALDKALALDKNNADAYAIRGIINRDYHLNFPEAYKSFDRALELDPNHILAHRWRSGLLMMDGRHDEAIEEIKKTIDLNPSWIWEHWQYANALIQARRYDEAIHQSDRVREMDPDFAAAYSTLWTAYYFKGDHLRAYENFLKGKKLAGMSDLDIANLETTFRHSGWLSVLRSERDTMIAKLENDYSPTKYRIAALSAVLGDNEIALKYLNECLDNRLIGLSLIKVDPFLDGLRGDPQFEEIVRKAGL